MSRATQKPHGVEAAQSDVHCVRRAHSMVGDR
jgi:hypothetical protein